MGPDGAPSGYWTDRGAAAHALLCLALAGMLGHSRAAYAQAPACVKDGQDCAVVAPERHVVTKIAYWKDALTRPVEQRVGPAVAEMLDYLTQDNIRNSIPNRPRAAVLTPEFVTDVRAALAELPEQVRRLFSGKLAGIQFVEDLGGTGYTEEIVDAESNPAAGFIVLDSAILSRQTANAWFTWKENTPFKPSPGFELVGEIEGKSEDTRKSAIQYILLHELAHVISIGEKIHPSWTAEPSDIQSTADYPYFSLSWAVERGSNRYVTVFDRGFPQRKDVVFYGEARLSGEQMVDIYDKLEATNFPTLYAVNRPGDDWAEAFVTYVHVVMMNKPFRIRLYREGSVVKDYTACWSERRCEEKKKILERFIAGG